MADSRAAVGEFKGHPVISFIYKSSGGEERRFTMGIKKGKLVLAHLDDLRAFVQANEEEP